MFLGLSAKAQSIVSQTSIDRDVSCWADNGGVNREPLCSLADWSNLSIWNKSYIEISDLEKKRQRKYKWTSIFDLRSHRLVLFPCMSKRPCKRSSACFNSDVVCAEKAVAVSLKMNEWRGWHDIHCSNACMRTHLAKNSKIARVTRGLLSSDHCWSRQGHWLFSLRSSCRSNHCCLSVTDPLATAPTCW